MTPPSDSTPRPEPWRDGPAPDPSHPEVAVLVSGGVDSAVLTAELRKTFERVHPIYVRFGLRWEEAELAALKTYLRAIREEFDGIEPITVFDEPIRDIYGTHWSTGGGAVPGVETPDEAVYLPGRNLLLTVKASIWCRLRGLGTMALGSLGSNPFPDSTPEFYRDLRSVLNRAVAGSIRLIRPFDRMHKADVLNLGRDLPLHLTLSCVDPIGGIHCGSCNKCAERHEGFLEAGIEDRTVYSTPTPPSSPRAARI